MTLISHEPFVASDAPRAALGSCYLGNRLAGRISSPAHAGGQADGRVGQEREELCSFAVEIHTLQTLHLR